MWWIAPICWAFSNPLVEQLRRRLISPPPSTPPHTKHPPLTLGAARGGRYHNLCLKQKRRSYQGSRWAPSALHGIERRTICGHGLAVEEFGLWRVACWLREWA